jgi:lipoyl(octanoyl) transferase
MGVRKWYDVDCGLKPYPEALDLQQELAAARRDGRLDTDVILWLEHPAVFTLGLRGGRENLLVQASWLQEKNIDLIQTNRGGNITYHGPGQLVAYPIIDLNTARLGVDDYVNRLETVMLETSAAFGVAAGRHDCNRGVWVGDRKLGSIGIAIKKEVAYHGFALNVAPSLEPFEWINPCGLERTAVTSLRKEGGGDISVDQVKAMARTRMSAVFDREAVATSIGRLKRIIEGKETR